MKKRFTSPICWLAAILFCLPYLSFGQAGFNLNKTYPGPEVASLGNFGLIPANPFNGQANLSIPLYTVKYKDIQVPLSLSYATGGHKVDDHPGWVGQGWGLQAGGMIYRKSNGWYDERPNPGSSIEQCYYYNCGRIPGDFNNADAIRKYALDGTTESETIANGYDAQPDEFIFNFNGYSGVFYISRASPTAPVELKIKPNGPYKLKAEITEIRDNIVFDDWWHVLRNEFITRQTARNIYSFKITDENGIQYFFGGTVQSIEFSNAGNLLAPENTIASSWHLTKILSPAGYEVQLNYKRVGRTLVQQKQRNALFYNNSFNFGGNTAILFESTSGSYSYSGTLEGVFIMIQNPVFLTSIVTPLQTVTFTSSRTNDLKYPYDAQKLDELTSPNNRFGADESYWQKLDEIDVQGLMKIGFNYLNQTDKRLRLQSFDLKTKNAVKISSYAFDYNPLSLPAYNSKMADHWGYYNGRSYAYTQNYLSVREPVAQYLQAEMLQTITYPTGGHLTMEYEPHYYKKIARQFPFNIELATSNTLAGGLRVKKMVADDPVAVKTVTKEYFYLENYIAGGANSSGVLSGIPQYTNTGSRRTSYQNGNFWTGTWGNFSMYYGKIVDNNFLLLGNTNGNHVTYSEVTEKSGEGYTVYKYYNHDNGYGDKAPYTTYTNFESKWQEEGFISLEAFRGLLQQSTLYDKNKNEVKSTAFEYACDTSSAYYRVPYFYRIYDESMGLPISRVSTCVFFTKPVLVKKKTDTEKVAGTTNTLTTITNYKLFPDMHPGADVSKDNFREAETSVTSSAGKTIKHTFAYAYDMIPTRDPNGIYQGMLNANMNSAVVEQVQYENTKQIALSRTNYFSPFSGYYTAQTVDKQKYSNTPETRVQYLSYDTKGNLLSQIPEDGVRTDFIWDYQQAYPVAEIKNMKGNHLAIAYTSFEANGSGHWNFNAANIVTDATTVTGAKCLNINAHTVTAGNLLSSATYIVSYWYKNGSAITVSQGTHSNIITGPVRNGWTYTQRTITGTTQVSISGTGFIDELRLYPAEAEMATYTFDPLNGMSGRCDARGVITRYEYDDFGRLLRVRDVERNILKQYDYQYQAYGHNNPVWQPNGNTRCKPCGLNANYTTDILQRQEVDINPNSSSTGTTRWVDVGVSSSCVDNPDWQNTATPLRCRTVNGVNTGEREQEQRSMNPCSGSFNSTRWVVVDQNCQVCPKPANYQPTGTTRCAKDANGKNTGYIEREERDNESCSNSFNQTRWVQDSFNIGACPITIYAKIVYRNGFNDGNFYRATVVICFFADAACTIPTSVSNLTVNYKMERINCRTGTVTNTNYSQLCSGTEHSLGLQVLSDDNGIHCWEYDYVVTPGTGYVPK